MFQRRDVEMKTGPTQIHNSRGVQHRRIRWKDARHDLITDDCTGACLPFWLSGAGVQFQVNKFQASRRHAHNVASSFCFFKPTSRFNTFTDSFIRFARSPSSAKCKFWILLPTHVHYDTCAGFHSAVVTSLAMQSRVDQAFLCDRALIRTCVTTSMCAKFGH